MAAVQDFSLHTHTIGFDGKNTVAEMAKAATDRGLKTIGISNHFIVHPKMSAAKCYAHAVSRGYGAIYNDNLNQILDRFMPHYAKIERIVKESNIQILRGMEFDFFDYPEWRNMFNQAMQILKPDYVIGACHFIEYNGAVCNIHDIANANPDDREKMTKAYWDKIARAAESGLFSWLAHLDLPKKVGIGTDEQWADVESDTIVRIAKSGTPIEINTGYRFGDDFAVYPSNRILRQVAELDIPVLISDDAHAVEQIGRHFDAAKNLCGELGVKNFIKSPNLLDFCKKTL